jgi:hypothetical protein
MSALQKKNNPARTIVVATLAIILVGFVAFATSQVAASRQPDVTGGTQVFKVDTASGKFVPAVISAKAGLPIEIVFGAGGNACAASATFDSATFKLAADLVVNTADGGTAKLPALAAGTYEWIAACSDVGGTITVQ